MSEGDSVFVFVSASIYVSFLSLSLSLSLSVSFSFSFVFVLMNLVKSKGRAVPQEGEDHRIPHFLFIIWRV